jgi:hypothetical protein
MALSFANVEKSPKVDHLAHGMQVRVVDMTVLNSDYSSGFDLQTNAQKIGFRRIFFVIGSSAKNGGGTFLPLLFWNWDFVAGKLRVANATSEANAVATLTDGSVIRMVVTGV